MHQPVADAVQALAAELGHAGPSRGAELRKAGSGRAREERERRVGRNREVGVEVEDLVNAGARPLHERARRARGRQRRAVQVGGVVRILARADGDAGAHEGRGIAGEHRRPVERERLRAEKRVARRVEDVHAHVIGVGPDGDVGIVEEVRAQVKAVAGISAGRVGRGGDGDALVCRNGRPGELADEPAVGELVVEHDRVAVAGRLADAGEAGPERGDSHRPEDGGARRLVEDLEAFIDDLDVLRQAHLAVRVGGRAVAHHARERDAVEVQYGGGHGRRGGEVPRLDDLVGTVNVMRRYSRVLVGLVLGPERRRGRRHHVAQRRRGVVVIRGADDHGVARGHLGGGLHGADNGASENSRRQRQELLRQEQRAFRDPGHLGSARRREHHDEKKRDGERGETPDGASFHFRGLQCCAATYARFTGLSRKSAPRRGKNRRSMRGGLLESRTARVQ